MKLPVFKLKVKEEELTNDHQKEFVALVQAPAVELEWFEFSKQGNLQFNVDEQRQIITGVVMVADMYIYRKMKFEGEEKEREFYVVADKSTVFDVVKKFFKNGYNTNFILNHSQTPEPSEDMYIFESIVVDSSRGIMPPKMFEGISEGSWIISLKVDNKEKWNEIKKQGLKGFSFQGIMGMEYVFTEDEKILETIADMTKGEN